MRSPTSRSFTSSEAAEERALLTGACRYKSIESILRNSLDLLPLELPPGFAPSRNPAPSRHDNIRRSRVLRRSPAMLNEPMMVKLFAMRLTSMSEALKAQEQDPAAAERVSMNAWPC